MPDPVPTTPPPATPPAWPRRKHYDAFLSYSRSAEGDFVPRIQAMLRGFGKGAAGPSDDRDLRLFVDRSGLAAHPHLWLEIKNCLAASDRLIVFASPGAAASEWVDKEVRWWLAERSIHTVYIALTSGEIVFDHRRGRIDAEATTALPPALIEHLDREPRWVDLRGPRRDPARTNHPELPNALAELAAPLRNVAKEDVLSAHITAQRHLNRRARALTSALSVLLALSVVNGALASHSAEREAAASYERDAHLLAAASHASRAEDPDLSQYLAAEAYHRAPGTQTRHAFLTATLDTPTDDQHLLRTVDTPGVTALAATGTGTVGRTATGGLLRWNPDDGDPEILPGASVTLPEPDLPAGSTAVAGSEDGHVVAAIDAAGIVLGRFPGDGGPLADEGDLVRLYRPLLDVADDERLDPTAVAVTPSGDALLATYETRGTCSGGATHQILRVALHGPEGDPLDLHEVAADTHAFFDSPKSRCADGGQDDPVRAVTTDIAAAALHADGTRRVVVADPRTGESRTLGLDTLTARSDSEPDQAPDRTVPAPSLTTWARLSGSGTATQVTLHHPRTRPDDGTRPTMSCPVPHGWRNPELTAVDGTGSRALVRTDDGLVACTAPRDMLWPRTRTWHLTGARPGALAVLAPEDRVVAAGGEELSLWRTTRESSDMDFPPGIDESPAAAPVVASRSGDRLPEHAATTALSWPDGTVQIHEKGTVQVPGLADGERLLPVWLTPSATDSGATSAGDDDLLLLAPDGRAWISRTDGLRPDTVGTLDPPAEPLPDFRDLLRRAHTAFTTWDRDGCLPRLEEPESSCPVLVSAHRTPDHLVLVDSTGGVYLMRPDLTEVPRYVPDELGIGEPIAPPWDEPGRVSVDDDGHWLAVAPRGRSLRVLDLTSPAPGWDVRGGAMAQVHLVPALWEPEGSPPRLVTLAEDGSVRTGAVAEDGPLLPLLSPGSHGGVLTVLAEPGLVVRNERTLLALFDIRSGARVGTIATSLRAARDEPDPGTVHAAHGRLLLVQEHGVTISRALDKGEDAMLREACVSAAPALTPDDLARLGVRHTTPRCRLVHTEGLPTFTDPGLLVPEARVAPPPFPPAA